MNSLRDQNHYGEAQSQKFESSDEVNRESWQKRTPKASNQRVFLSKISTLENPVTVAHNTVGL